MDVGTDSSAGVEQATLRCVAASGNVSSRTCRRAALCRTTSTEHLRKFRLILWTELPLEATLLCLYQAAQGLLLSGDPSGSSCLSPGAEALGSCYSAVCVPGRHSDLALGNGLSPRNRLFPQVTIRALASGSHGRPFIRASHP